MPQLWLCRACVAEHPLREQALPDSSLYENAGPNDGWLQVVAAIRMAMYQIGQLERCTGKDNQTAVDLYWLDAVRDVPMLCGVLLDYLPKLQASPCTLFQV